MEGDLNKMHDVSKLNNKLFYFSIMTSMNHSVSILGHKTSSQSKDQIWYNQSVNVKVALPVQSRISQMVPVVAIFVIAETI